MYAIKAERTGMRMVTDKGHNPAWSPAADRWVYSYVNLFSIRLDGTGTLNLTGNRKRVPECDDAASWGQ